MSSNNEISDILDEFNSVCDDMLNNVYTTIELGDNSGRASIINEKFVPIIVEQSFMKIFIQWEKFLQNLFIAYMLGCRGIDNQLIVKYVSPPDKEYAYAIIRGTNQYPDWTDFAKIKLLADNFFSNNNPFSILEELKQTYLEMKKIRNHISHASTKSLEEFEKLVRNKMGYLPDNISCCSFLMETVREQQEIMYFEFYVEYIKSLAETLANPI